MSARALSSPAHTRWMVTLILLTCLLALASVMIGVYSLNWHDIRTQSDEFDSWMVLVVSRVPRTMAIILIGASTSITGMIMQMLSRNKFVSPGTSGTVESASLGILIVTLLYPAAPIGLKILFATMAGMIGTAFFLFILRQIPMKSPLMVPLIGIMLGGVIGSITSFYAYRYELLQSLNAWTNGDFSRVLKGRYELLYLSGLLTAISWFAADRFTVAGLGESFTTNLGLNYGRVMAFGLAIVAAVTAVNVVTVGAIPFLGLVVPNVVSAVMGDNVRRTAPWVAIFGAMFLLACDIAGRTLRYPYEIPISVVVGVVGSVMFLVILLRRGERVA
ncbi:MAG: iron chelate uptake ABC transporter family permease subunit [Thermomicrobiales bacterium]|nr:iron chelate uptake ABC transporter family permease subunit [Thermomicrobiales bacterium]